MSFLISEAKIRRMFKPFVNFLENLFLRLYFFGFIYKKHCFGIQIAYLHINNHIIK